MIYKITLWHHKKDDGLQQFEYAAHNDSGKWVGSHFTEETRRDDRSKEFLLNEVMSRNVFGETPYNAICRFMEWQSKGLPESFLIMSVRTDKGEK